MIVSKVSLKKLLLFTITTLMRSDTLTWWSADLCGEYRAASTVEVWSPPGLRRQVVFQRKTTCRPPLETLGCGNTVAPIDNDNVEVVFQASSPYA